MIVSTKFVSIVLLCFVSGFLSKPTAENDLPTGRGIGSTLWGWITYPFSWWISEPELPVNEPLIGSTTTFGPQESIEIRKRNITIWCNDQTCTTMKCDTFGCSNITCNIYDTDLMGECREYDILSTPEHLPKPTEPIPKLVEVKVTESISIAASSTAAPATTTENAIPKNDKRPLGLDILSSTINKND